MFIYLDLIWGKYDVGVVGRLVWFFCELKVVVVVIVGVGDKMFWGWFVVKRVCVLVIILVIYLIGWLDWIG